MAASYYVNTAYPLTATIKDATGTLADADTVAVDALSPSNVISTVNLTRQSLGVYTGTWKPTAAGAWKLTLKTVNPDIHGKDIDITVTGSFSP